MKFYVTQNSKTTSTTNLKPSLSNIYHNPKLYITSSMSSQLSIPSDQNLATAEASINEEKWENFTPRYKVISSDDLEKSYQPRGGLKKTSVSWGQRKLALSIVQFLSDHWDKQIVPNPILLYIGAAPGNNIEYIMTNLFPDFTVHLYDPREMKVSPTDKMVVHKQLFTDETALQWSNRNDVFLMSDIRSVDSLSTDEDTREKGIWEDMQLQARIYETVRPVRAMLKFRLPYYIEKVTSRYSEYLYGLVYRGIWARQRSTETRLVPMTNSDGIDRISWDNLKYESQMYYHNVEVREKVSFRNPFYNEDDNESKTPVDGIELTNDYDSISETIVWRDYLRKVGGKDIATLENVRKLSRALTQFLAGNRSAEDRATLAKLRENPLLIKGQFE